MNTVIKAGVGLAVLVEIITVILMATGVLLANPMLGGVLLIVLAIALNGVAIFWGLKQTAADCGYGKQLLNGLLIGVIAGVLIFVFSYVNLSLLFPDYLEESKTATIVMLENIPNMPDEALQTQIAKIEDQTVVGQAISGTIGTIITSLILGAIIAIFKRKK